MFDDPILGIRQTINLGKTINIIRNNNMYYNNIIEFIHFINGFSDNKKRQFILFLAEGFVDKYDAIRKILNMRDYQFVGGVFPGIIYGNRCYDEGFIAIEVNAYQMGIVKPFDSTFDKIRNDNNGTAIVLIDGVSSKFKMITDTIKYALKGKYSYIGGGAGYLDFTNRPCIFDNYGLYSDVAAVILTPEKSNSYILNEWERFLGPFYVTAAEGIILSELNSQDAFSVYRDEVFKKDNFLLTKESFLDYAKTHPLGIANGEQLIVRDPIKVFESGEIQCVADVKQGSDLYILKRKEKAPLEKEHFNFLEDESNRASPIIFDCISRAVNLKKDYFSEIEKLQSKIKNTIFGALSIGEISSSSNNEPLIHNKILSVNFLKNF